jgi:hypothetical protein
MVNLQVPSWRETRLRLVRVLALVFYALLIDPTPPAMAHDTTLQVDGYTSGQNAAFQSGFIAGEIGAVRLTPPGPFPMQLKEVLFLFGGTSAQAQLVLRIYDDSAGTLNPGVELFSDTYLVDASNTVFQSITLTGENILLNGAVRVGIEMVQGGLPSIARDDDGTINGTHNFIKSISGWDESQTFGLTGDWIIRAVVTDDPVPTTPVTWGQIKSMHGH